MLKYFISLLLIVGASNITFSQKTDVGNWFMYFGNQKINDKWSFWNEVQYRNYNFAGDLEQLLLRTAIGYNLTENNNTIYLGYGFIRSEPYIAGTNNKRVVNEHRIYQQFMTKQSIGRISLTHRYRFEQRFIGEIFKLRLRYFLSAQIPLNNASLIPKTFYLSAYNELFAQVKSPIFDRDRFYGGLGYVINPSLRLEIGFLQQYYENSNRPQFQFLFFNNYPFPNKNK